MNHDLLAVNKPPQLRLLFMICIINCCGLAGIPATAQFDMLELIAHGNSVEAARFSPDGSAVVTASQDTKVVVWDAVDGSQTRTLENDLRNQIFDAAYSPDGSAIVTARKDGIAILWRVDIGQPIDTLTGHNGSVFSLAYSPDGSMIATGSQDWLLRIFDAASADLIRDIETNENFAGINDVAFSPDNLHVVSAGADGLVKVWEVATGDLKHTLDAHPGGAQTAIYSPDGTIIVTGGADLLVKIWNAETGEFIDELEGHGGAVNDLDFSDGGTLLLSGSDDATAKVWDVASWDELQTLIGHNSAVNSVDFAPDSTIIVTAGNDDRAIIWSPETVGVRDATTRSLVRIGNFPNPCDDATKFSYAIAKPGRIVLRIFDLAGRVIATPVDEFQSVGEYEFPFNVAHLPIGRYIYALQSGDQRLSGVMAVIR